MAEKQLNVRVKEERFDLLDDALSRHPEATKASVIEDLILFLPLWEEMQEEITRTKKDFVKKQLVSEVAKRRAG